MTDLTIPQIPADPADANLRPGDKLLANRAGVDVSAVVPTYPELTNGKLAVGVLPDEQNTITMQLDRDYDNYSYNDNFKYWHCVPIFDDFTLSSIDAYIWMTDVGSNTTTGTSTGARLRLEWLVTTSNPSRNAAVIEPDATGGQYLVFDPLADLRDSFESYPIMQQKTFASPADFTAQPNDAKALFLYFNDDGIAGGSLERERLLALFKYTRNTA